MGGEQSILPGTLIADRFADYGVAALIPKYIGGADNFRFAVKKKEHLCRCYHNFMI